MENTIIMLNKLLNKYAKIVDTEREAMGEIYWEYKGMVDNITETINICESEPIKEVDASEKTLFIKCVRNPFCSKGLNWNNCAEWTISGKCDKSCNYFQNDF